MADTNRRENQEISTLLNCFDIEKLEQLDNKLLHISIEKDFRKKASHTAHEIRNPLCAMELHSKIISKRLDSIDEESICSIKNSIGCIINSIEVLKNITNGLRDFAKELTLDIKNENITALTQRVIETIEPLFDEKNIEVVFHQSEEIFCECDEKKTFQILFNLLKNALEASNEGDKVDVYFIQNNNEISILVKDTGCGVASHNIEKIFYPNFTTKETGSGIGLCESREIARAQKGDVRLIATGKNGSIFGLILPKK
ncbi:MAG: HAMP domain-containing sensor histidine kinase [Candidatus Gastranaerophilales bacterium]|nr:HAMP domain-containing sensor histidine kinase [Candidatus Gastranaerophilales bacterium]